MMEENESNARRWEDLNNDALVKIFRSFDIFELTSGIAHVCHTWRWAACDSLLWRTLDLSVLKSNYIKIPLDPYVFVDSQSDKTLTRLLKITLNLSRGHILTLIFNLNLFVSNDQLIYTAERSPRLRRLVMPTWNRIRKTGLCDAIRKWEDLQSLTMPSIGSPPYVMEEISRSCRKFSELKIIGQCNIIFANALVQFLPNLKVLSIRCSKLTKDALIIILDGLQRLEVLNISHCLLVDSSASKIIVELDESILARASRLRQFLTCMDDSCIMCTRTRNDDGVIRWYKYEDGLWKVDEVKSLAV